jgi:hypothetical protein
MKLIDFTTHEKLNDLRKRMDAPLVKWEASDWIELDSEELRRKLDSIEGIEVEIDEIVTSSDKTFEYKDQKVLVYIRDQYSNPRYPDKEYKFHISSCTTMQKAFTQGRSDRYVVSTRIDGRFLVNVKEFPSGKLIKDRAIEELHVCKNCLLELRYKGYNSHSKCKLIYSSFQLKEFFEMYRGTQFTRTPQHSDLTAPLDQYSVDFDKLSHALKEKNGWQCEKCGRNLKEYKEYLQTHHKNGIKGDNSLGNLMTLCIGCHSEAPEHGHLRFTPQYAHFMDIFGD